MEKQAIPRAPAQDWDPRAADVMADQLAAYDRMREQCPVAHSDFLGWSLFRYEDIVQVSRDTATFSSAASRRRRSGNAEEPPGQIPLGLDPPEHTFFRKFLNPYFSDDRMEEFEPQVRQLAVAALGPLVGAGEGEFIRQFARPYPLRALCAFLNWDPRDAGQIGEWSAAVERAGLRGEAAEQQRVLAQWHAYISGALEDRRRRPLDPGRDVATGLLMLQVEGQPLGEERIVGALRLLLEAGHGTTTSSLGIVVSYLAGNLDVQDELRASPAAIPAAVKEILRHDGPLSSMFRTAVKAAEIGGRQIRAGDRVSLMYLSGDRDDEVFPRGDRCEIGRRPRRQDLVFGSGIHTCLGARLARLELRVAVEELLARTQCFRHEQDGAPPRLKWPGNGIRRLQLRFEAR